MFCGKVLNDTKSCETQGIIDGITIQVVKKRTKAPKKIATRYTEADVQEIVWMFKSLLNTRFHQKASRPDFLIKVIKKFPELKTDTAALTILKDPVLLSSMQNSETVRKLIENHPVLIDAAEFIVSSLKEITVPMEVVPLQVADNIYDSSSSSSDNESPSTTREAARRITRNQLTTALAMAGSNSFFSLDNIAQRATDEDGTAVPTTSTPNTPNPAGNPRITSSMFSNAISQALSDRPATLVSQSIASLLQPQGRSESATSEPSPPAYLAELGQMREMGLTDNVINLQALILCNGNVDAAINLIFSGVIS